MILMIRSLFNYEILRLIFGLSGNESLRANVIHAKLINIGVR
jgi:hypothetical protein